MRCEEVQNKIADLIDDGERSPIPPEMELHFNSCAACQREFDSIKEVCEKLAGFPKLDPDQNTMRSRFNAMVESNMSSRRIFRFWPRRPIFQAVFMALILVVALFVAQRAGVVAVTLPTARSGNITPPVPAASVAATERVIGVVSGSMEGIVLQSGTMEPVSNVRISLTASDRVALQPLNYLSTTTDRSGRFKVQDIPPGSYSVVLQPSGLLQSEAIGPTTITIASGENVRNIAYALRGAGAVEGRIVDPGGQPAIRVDVDAMQIAYQGGRRVLLRSKSGARTLTDDRGQYRIFALPPGEYFIRAENSRYGTSVLNGLNPLSYFPGTADPVRAERIFVRAGEDAVVNFSLQTAPAFRISGRVIENGSVTPGKPITSFYLIPRVANADTGVVMDLPRTMSVESKVRSNDGTFEIDGIVSGVYDLYPIPRNSKTGQLRYGGRTRIEVRDHDLENVTVALNSGSDLRGILTIDGDSHSIRLDQIHVYLKSKENLPPNSMDPQAAVNLSGEFQMHDVPSGAYDISVFGLPMDAYVANAAGPRGSYDTGFTFEDGNSEQLKLVVSLSGGTLNGTVRNRELKIAPGAFVALVPQTRTNSGLFKFAKSDQSGHFSLRGIAPGQYQLFAWDELPEGAAENPVFLSRYEKRGRTVVVGHNTKLDVQLSLIYFEP